MSSEKEPSNQEGPVIEFPTDPDIVEKLRNKLEEYQSRVGKMKDENSFRAPEMSKPDTVDARYKIAVLKAVLDGGANTYEIARKLAEEDGDLYDVSVFENACGVIKSYCEGDTGKISGGTGLKGNRKR